MYKVKRFSKESRSDVSIKDQLPGTGYTAAGGLSALAGGVAGLGMLDSKDAKAAARGVKRLELNKLAELSDLDRKFKVDSKRATSGLRGFKNRVLGTTSNELNKLLADKYKNTDRIVESYEANKKLLNSKASKLKKSARNKYIASAALLGLGLGATGLAAKYDKNLKRDKR